MKGEVTQWLECWPVTPKVAGSTPVFLDHLFFIIMRVYINGKLSAFQAEDMSSILITRIVLFSKIYTGRLMRERKILFMHS